MNLSLFKKIIFSLIGTLLLAMAIEIFSLLALSSYSLIIGLPLKSVYLLRRYELLTAWRGVITMQEFDPLLQMGIEPNSDLNGLSVNKDGFVSNGHKDVRLNAFPDKPNDVFRIILIGGSTTLGIAGGVGSDRKTIAAILERQINKTELVAGKKVQVLNFGLSATNSSTELMKFMTQVIHFKPDMIVTLDGSNEAWYAIGYPKLLGLPHGIINWPETQYHQFDTWHKVKKASRPVPVRIFTFTHQLLLTIFDLAEPPIIPRDKKIQIYEKFPLYAQSGFLQKEDPYNTAIFYSNMDALAAVCHHRKILYIGYLQPISKQFKTLTPNEELAIQSQAVSFSQRSWYGFPMKDYLDDLDKAFTHYGDMFKNLQSIHQNTSGVAFYDIRQIFEKEPRTIYLDTVHYNHLGHQMIADRYQQDIVRLVGKTTLN